MEQLIEIMINIIKKSALPFIVSTMLLIIIGSFIGKDMSTISTLCTPQGIPFTSLFQLMGLSIIIGIINTIFDLSNTLKKNKTHLSNHYTCFSHHYHYCHFCESI